MMAQYWLEGSHVYIDLVNCDCCSDKVFEMYAGEFIGMIARHIQNSEKILPGLYELHEYKRVKLIPREYDEDAALFGRKLFKVEEFKC